MNDETKKPLALYLAGVLPISRLRARLAASRHRGAKSAMDLAEFDQICRHTLSSLEPRAGAAERLAELVSNPAAYSKPDSAAPSRNTRGFVPPTLSYDVVGAQCTPEKQNARKKRAKIATKAKVLPERTEFDPVN